MHIFSRRRSVSINAESRIKSGSLLKAGVEEAAGMTSLPTRMGSNSVKTFIPRIISLRSLPYCAPPTEKTATFYKRLLHIMFNTATEQNSAEMSLL